MFSVSVDLFRFAIAPLPEMVRVPVVLSNDHVTVFVSSLGAPQLPLVTGVSLLLSAANAVGASVKSMASESNIAKNRRFILVTS